MWDGSAWRFASASPMPNTCSKHRRDNRPHEGPQWPTSSSSGARGSTTSRTSRSTCPATPSSCSPACPGSGKSSLAFDTIFAEGQRRYVESLSAYARQFLGQMDKPDVDFIEGLSPAVSIDQKSTSQATRARRSAPSPRSTTTSACCSPGSAGRTARPAARPIERQTPQQIVDRVLALEDGRRFQVLAPVIRGRKGEYVELFRQLQTQGFSRARVDGETHPLDRAAQARQAEEAHDRGRRRPARGQGVRQAAADRLGRDRAQPRRRPGAARLRRPRRQGPRPRAAVLREDVVPQRAPHRHRRARAAVVLVQLARSAPAPSATASAPGWRSTPSSSCPTRPPSLGEGAIQPWGQAHVADYFQRLLGALGDELGFDLDTPWEELTATAAEVGAVGPPHQGPRRHPQPLRPRALLLRPVRGRAELHRAASPRGRVRHQPRALRGLHARGAVPGVRRLPAQAGLGLGDRRRAATSPTSARSRSTRPPSSCAAST